VCSTKVAQQWIWDSQSNPEFVEREDDQAVVAETDAPQKLPLEIIMCGTRSVN
jgi:hypothetical protein